jgi:glutamine cyclotransferase
MNGLHSNGKHAIVRGKSSRTVPAVMIGLCCIMLIRYDGFASAISSPGDRYRPSPVMATLAPVHGIDIVRTFPHDPQSFTQGLVFYNGYLYESSGLYGRSSLRKTDIKTGKVIKEIKLDSQYFAEGIAILGHEIFQLSWREETGFRYGLKTLRKIGRFAYHGEGWGLTTDGRHLIMSNGSSIITFHSPDTYSITRRINVHDGNRPIGALNELEFIKGEIWANVFMENVMVRISPETGKVLGWIDLSLLFQHLDATHKIDVLNGIAYDEKTNRIFVTGKFWPLLFEIKITGQP